MKTLYVSDLDGTLLDSNATLSEKTKDIINSLVKKGMNFTFATARSLSTAQKVTKGLNLNLPVIVYNGTFLMDKQNGKIISDNVFEKCDTQYVVDRIKKYNLSPLVYSFKENKECVFYNENRVTDGMNLYLESRKNDKRLTPQKNSHSVYQGNIFYFTFISSKDKLLPFYNDVKENDNLRVTLQQDIYNEHYWCEIMSIKASKANAILKMKEIFGFDRIVSFGDAINDIPMFKISDECYAVDNAVKELKQISTKEISSNDKDGVALWLKENYNLSADVPRL